MTTQTLIVDIDTSFTICVRFPGGMRTTHKTVNAAIKYAVKHIKANNLTDTSIVLTPAAIEQM